MSIDIDIRNIRRDYNLAELNENNLRNDPLELFEIWLQEALEKEIKEPNAMALSTVEENKPKTRIVLLKQIKEGKFLFFTNYNSNKAKEIERNSNVSLTFFWEELQSIFPIITNKFFYHPFFIFRGFSSFFSLGVFAGSGAFLESFILTWPNKDTLKQSNIRMNFP